MATHTNLHGHNHVEAVDKEAIGEQLSLFSRIITKFGRSFMASVRASREIEELSRLSDHQLRDIGLPRHEIAHRVYDHHFPKRAGRN